MGPWEEGRECVGACVAWCDRAHVYAACMQTHRPELQTHTHTKLKPYVHGACAYTYRV